MQSLLTHRKRRADILRSACLRLPMSLVSVAGMPPALLPSESLVWARGPRAAWWVVETRLSERRLVSEPGWRRVADLGRGDFAASPADLGRSTEPPGGDPGSLDIIRAYAAGMLCATGWDGLDLEPVIPGGDSAFGMPLIVASAAARSGLLALDEDGWKAAPAVVEEAGTISSRGLGLESWNAERRAAALRGWMETPGAYTPLPGCALSIVRLMRSLTLRPARVDAVEDLERGRTLHSVSPAARGLRDGPRLEMGASWSRVLSVEPCEHAEHACFEVALDDSRAHAGFYLRDSHLLPPRATAKHG